MTDRLPNIHPGEILAEEFLAPLELSQNALAIALAVPATRISEIVRGQRAITADTALRLARYFGTTPQFWLNLQNAYDLEEASRAEARAIARIEPRPVEEAIEEPTLEDFHGTTAPVSGRNYEVKVERPIYICTDFKQGFSYAPSVN